jgi:hypothetical protein
VICTFSVANVSSLLLLLLLLGNVSPHSHSAVSRILKCIKTLALWYTKWTSVRCTYFLPNKNYKPLLVSMVQCCLVVFVLVFLSCSSFVVNLYLVPFFSQKYGFIMCLCLNFLNHRSTQFVGITSTSPRCLNWPEF